MGTFIIYLCWFSVFISSLMAIFSLYNWHRARKDIQNLDKLIDTDY